MGSAPDGLSRPHPNHEARALSRPPKDGGYTLFFKADIGKSGRFFDPDKVPEFEGEEAWFEIQNVGGGLLAVLRQVEAPAGGRR